MSSKSKKQNIESAGVGHEWIKTRLREVGKQVKDLAEALDQPPPRISEKIKGKLEFQADDIPVIAKVLELPINEVLAKLPFQGKGLLPEGFTLVEVQGAAKAGEWMKAVQLKEKNWGYVLVPKEAEYPYVSALRVTGDDMEKFYAPDQSVVLFSPYEQYKKKIHDADHVIVERSDGNGQKEITVKELKIEDDGRVWLVPHSKNPQYKPIEISKLDSVKTYYGNDMLKITGVVVKVITDYKPQRSSKNISLPKSL